jgi:hypothetical protein
MPADENVEALLPATGLTMKVVSERLMLMPFMRKLKLATTFSHIIGLCMFFQFLTELPGCCGYNSMSKLGALYFFTSAAMAVSFGHLYVIYITYIDDYSQDPEAMEYFDIFDPTLMWIYKLFVSVNLLYQVYTYHRVGYSSLFLLAVGSVVSVGHQCVKTVMFIMLLRGAARRKKVDDAARDAWWSTKEFAFTVDSNSNTAGGEAADTGKDAAKDSTVELTLSAPVPDTAVTTPPPRKYTYFSDRPLDKIAYGFDWVMSDEAMEIAIKAWVDTDGDQRNLQFFSWFMNIVLGVSLLYLSYLGVSNFDATLYFHSSDSGAVSGYIYNTRFLNCSADFSYTDSFTPAYGGTVDQYCSYFGPPEGSADAPVFTGACCLWSVP